MPSNELQLHIRSCSEKGLSSVTTLIIGSKSAVLIDPPFLVPDAEATVEWIKKLTPNPLVALFVTHHHPDHYFSANPILDAFPGSKLYAAPYVLAGINREYDEKIVYWPNVFGKENVPAKPTKPTPYPYSFFLLDEHRDSPVMLMGPVQGDSVDHTLFWLPRERALICGDAIYARSTHVWAEEIETTQILNAWENTLSLIEALNPKLLIPGHLEEGWTLDTAADMEHNRAYLKLFRETITNAKSKPSVDSIWKTFQDAFPKANKNLDFFLGHLSNQFGEGGKVWEENRHHNVSARTADELDGYILDRKS